MRLAQRVLEIAAFHGAFNEAAVPQTLQELGQRLSVIADAIQFLQERSDKKSPRLESDFTALLDLCFYQELQNDDRHMHDVSSEFPATDPLTILEVAQDYGVVENDVANSLTAEFIKKASGAAGHQLGAKEIKALYALFRHYDPVDKIGLT